MPIQRSANPIQLRSSASFSPMTAFLLPVLCGAAFFVRTYFVAGAVFQGGQVVFHEADPWYHVRAVKNVVANFPRPIFFDPYLFMPDGQGTPVAPLFDWIMAAACIIAGGGHPSEGLIERVCAFCPPVMGMLVVLLTYFIGKRLFDRKAGLLAAALLTICPGNFLRCSLLGYTDHHVCEVLLSTLTMLALIAALRAEHVNQRALRPTIFSWLAALSLLSYGLAWSGAALLVAILAVWLIVQLTNDHVRGRDVAYLGRVAIPLFGLPLLIIVSMWRMGYEFEAHVLTLGGALAATLVLLGLSTLVRRRGQPNLYLAAMLLGVPATIGVISLISPGTIRLVLSWLHRFHQSGGALTLSETVPLLKGAQGWTLKVTYSHYGSTFWLALIALVMTIWRALRTSDATLSLLAIWSIGMLLATLGQNRFGYYYAVDVSLLSAFLAGRVIDWARNEEKSRRTLLLTASWLVIVLIWFIPSIPPALLMACASSMPNADWRHAMAWLRKNTPEPFDDTNYFYAPYPTSPQCNSYVSPASAYGIMCWWDYGYWVIEMGRRIPNSNPTQRGAQRAARFFLAQSEAEADDLLDKCRSRYIAVDCLMSFAQLAGQQKMTSKFYSMVEWAGLPQRRFMEEWTRRATDGSSQRVMLYYPEFYQTLLSRLYLFRGMKVPSVQACAAKLREETGPPGKAEKILEDLRRFSGEEEARKFISSEAGKGYRLVGISPFITCVSVEPLHHYSLVYQSPSRVGDRGGRPVSYVEIYEYMKKSSNASSTPPSSPSIHPK